MTPPEPAPSAGQPGPGEAREPARPPASAGAGSFAEPPLGPVLVIGAGLVGASVGLALQRSGVAVHLSDRIRSHAVVAAGLGAGVVAAPDAAEVQVVVVAVPPDAAAAVIAQALADYPNAVVTDVVSVKRQLREDVVGRAGRNNPDDSRRYVGSHPMAGSQHTGPLTASADLFLDRTWVITADAANPGWAVARVHALARLTGAQVVTMPTGQHDEAVAQVSHVPQLVSTLMAGHLRGVPASHLQLAGQGIRDVTRIAGSDPVLWRQIITANAGAIRHELEGLRADLDELLEVLDDPDRLEDFMARGRAGARSLPGKHGLRPREYESVVVEIPDAPGALSRLFADVGAAGVNVEDLAIAHDPAREVGFLSVDVDPAVAERLRASMLEAGWRLA